MDERPEESIEECIYSLVIMLPASRSCNIQYFSTTTSLIVSTLMFHEYRLLYIDVSWIARLFFTLAFLGCILYWFILSVFGDKVPAHHGPSPTREDFGFTIHPTLPVDCVQSGTGLYKYIPPLSNCWLVTLHWKIASAIFINDNGIKLFSRS